MSATISSLLLLLLGIDHAQRKHDGCEEAEDGACRRVERRHQRGGEEHKGEWDEGRVPLSSVFTSVTDAM